MSSIDWSSVGNWIKDNAGKELALVGSLVTGNVPGAVAAGVSMIQTATGSPDAAGALAALQNDPQSLVKLKQIAADNEENIRKHLEAMQSMKLQDEQAAQHEQQETIRGGDQSTDEYVRRTRPQMARQSWAATVAYLLLFSVGHALQATIPLPSVAVAGVLIGPAAAYMGFRAVDKWGAAKFGSATGAMKAVQ